ncbi:MAG: DUF3104 domain-containing protein [Ruminococcaceae bacterium]|nr:DUF3104 domain-containing protein [Oscillospiraceae bacterium]
MREFSWWVSFIIKITGGHRDPPINN